jgi:hypothetical protein
MEQEQRTLKIRTYAGKILTIKIKEQTDEYISGTDLFGVFTKIQLKDIAESIPITREVREE